MGATPLARLSGDIATTPGAAGPLGPQGCGEVRDAPGASSPTLLPAPQDLQVGDARLPDGGGDGFDGRAEGVEELSELPGAFRPPAFLHHEAGHGDDIGVEGGTVRHGGGDGRLELQLSPPPLAPGGRGRRRGRGCGQGVWRGKAVRGPHPSWPEGGGDGDEETARTPPSSPPPP